MTGICFCLTPGNFGFSPTPTKPMIWACSPAHLAIRERNYGKENAMTEMQDKARAEAGRVAGGYLESLGRTDLAALSPEEWDILLQAVIETYWDEMNKACEPF